MQILLSTGLTFKVMTNEAAADHALSWGYDGIEWMMQPKRPRSLNEKHPGDGLVCTHQAVKVIHAPFSLQGRQPYWNSIHEAISAARWNGHHVPTINVHPHSCRFLLGGFIAQARAAERIKELEKAHQLTLAVEVLPRPRGSWFTVKRWFNWLQQPFVHLHLWETYIGAAKLHTTIDTTHLATWGVIEPARFVTLLKPYLAHVHLSDYIAATDTEHIVPGEGDLALKEFLQALQQDAPDITVTVELQPVSTSSEVESCARRSLDFVRSALA